jgi:hypothetical protein
MTSSVDLLIHGLEALAIVFWIGVTYGDIQWMKKELHHLRNLMEINFGIGRK